MITTISTLPASPNRNDPGTFSDRADALLGAMPTLVTELNSFVTEVNTLSFKTACKAATTAAITLSGQQTIDGQSAVSGDRVLVKNQGTTAQNGIYTVSINAWTRAPDMDTAAEVAGSFVPITYGVVNGGKIFYTTFNATGSTLGTTDIPWNSLTEGTITGVGVIAPVNGGTGISSYAVGDLIYANGTTSLVKLAAAASGNVLKSGTAPSWGKVVLTTDISGTLPVANGGTGLTSSTGGSGVTYLTANGIGGWIETNLPISSTSISGIVQLATDAEVSAGTVSNKALTPSGLRAGALVAATAKSATSGSSLDFTSIPSWVKRITIILDSVSTTGTSAVMLQLGTGGTPTTTGYTGVAMASGNNTTYTNGLAIDRSGNASFSRIGTAVFTKITGNTWVGTYFGDVGSAGGTEPITISTARVALSGTLNIVRITTTSADTFDAGTVNIFYE